MKSILICPSYETMLDNVMLNVDSEMNRDDYYRPYHELREKLLGHGYDLRTIDRGDPLLADHIVFFDIPPRVSLAHRIRRWAKGQRPRRDYIRYCVENRLRDRMILFLSEAPTWSKANYDPRLHESFKTIFTWNDDLVDGTRYLKLYWPQSRSEIMEDLWTNDDRGFLAMINANKGPLFRIKDKDKELYGERIKAIEYFGRTGEIDLYGFGWDRRPFLFLPYWFNRKAILRAYKGAVRSKHETLSKYTFAICYENAVFPGYVTEKIFDCFFVGTIPVYLGAPNIEEYVPDQCFIDRRDFGSYGQLGEYLRSLSKSEINAYRESIRQFLTSEQFRPFTKEYFAEMFIEVIMSG